MACGLCEQDGWHSRPGQLCAAPVRKGLPDLPSVLSPELRLARAGPPLRHDREPAGEAVAATEFAYSLEQVLAERGQPLPGDILGSLVMLARMVGRRPLDREPLSGIQVPWRAFENVQAMRRLL